MFTKDYWSFEYLDKLTDEQRKSISHIGESVPEKKIKQEYMGPKKRDYKYRSNPNWYLKITPEEIERQYQEAMSQMQKDTKWHKENIINNMKPMSDEKIISLYQKGMSIEEIWSKYQVPESIIRHVLAVNQIEIRENNH